MFSLKKNNTAVWCDQADNNQMSTFETWNNQNCKQFSKVNE